MNYPTCSRCEHFRQFPGYKEGWCYGVMPMMFAGGFEPPNPPKVKGHRPACVGFKDLGEGVETLVYSKVTPETVGDAIKQKQEMVKAETAKHTVNEVPKKNRR